jgi:hypothetical protein
MSLFSLFRFYKEASKYIPPDPAAVEEAGEDQERHLNYHQRIVVIACLSGALGFAGGLAYSIAGAGNPQAKGVLAAPFMLGAVGLLFGACVACLFAPRAFLTGPVGRKWMKLIGTESVAGARFVCALFALVIAAPVVGIGLLLAFGP